VIKKCIQLNNRKLVDTVLYADDQISMATSEDDLQTMAHDLNLIAIKYKMTISSTKTKSMAMCGKHIQRVNIVINDNIIEQVTDFIEGSCESFRRGTTPNLARDLDIFL